MSGERRRVIIAAAFALLLGVVASPAQAASAASDPLGVSHDGVTFASAYSGNLFGGAQIVPGGTITRSFWVKNQASTAGNLAVAIRDVGGTDGVFISALSVSADAGVGSGPTVELADVAPCSTLVRGVGMSAGAIVRVDVSLALSDTLTGTEAQRSLGEFDIIATLTSTDVAAPDGCTAPVAPPGGGSGGTVTIPGAGGASTGTTSTGTTTPGETPSATPTPAPTPVPLPDSGGGSGIATGGPTWNTDRFFQEFTVAWWVLAFVLGGVYAWLRDRRRERIPQ
ncbi:MAG: hypothetical protein DI534_03330 [Leifsonia xyli]|nr:MAG: hypothetical protein DI534_03330 [Leifsonia xyli]